MSLLQNGRPATQSDIAILRQHLDGRFDRIEQHYDELDQRVRCVEVAVARDDTREETLAAAQSAEEAVRSEQGISRRWRVGLALTMLATFSTSLIALVKP